MVFFHYNVNLLLPLSCLLPLNVFEIVQAQVKFAVWKVVICLCHSQMTQYVENFNLQIRHDHICWRNQKIQSRSLMLYFRAGQSSPYNFPYVSLVSPKLKQIPMKKL